MKDGTVQATAFDRPPGICTGQCRVLNPKMYITSQLSFIFLIFINVGKRAASLSFELYNMGIITNSMIKGPGHSGSGGHKDDGTAGRGQPTDTRGGAGPVWLGFRNFVKRNQSEIFKCKVSRFLIVATNNCFHKNTVLANSDVGSKVKVTFSHALPQGQRARVGGGALPAVSSHRSQGFGTREAEQTASQAPSNHTWAIAFTLLKQ